MATSIRPIRDEFERHYAEKIWELIPEVYRNEDGLADMPGQLRALVELLAGQAAIQRRSIDRLLADSRIEEADDWAVAYIGQLLGTRFGNPLNSAGRRADVRNTLGYRRRAGTARLIEALARDIARWDARLSEGFRRLVRFPHGLDRDFAPGPVTATPPGAFADLRRTRVGDVVDGAFDDLAHFPDFRPGPGRKGMYNIPRANLFLYRVEARRLTDFDPVRLDGRHWVLDPSGRGNAALFQPGDRNLDDCTAPQEWQLQMPITCRRLGAVRYELPQSEAGNGTNWSRLVGRSFDAVEDLLAAAADVAAGNLAALPDAALDPASIKAHLLDTALSDGLAFNLAPGGTSVSLHEMAPAGLENWADGVTPGSHVRAMVDPAHGLVQLVNPANQLGVGLLHYGQYLGLGAGTHDRSATIPAATGFTPTLSPNWTSLAGDVRFGNSRTYTPTTTTADKLTVTATTRIWALDQRRPYVVLRPSAGTNVIELKGQGTAGAPDLLINGLWLGQILSGAALAGGLAILRLTGHWNRIDLQHVTLDPGGIKVALAGSGSTPAVAAGDPIAHVRLEIAGVVEELAIANSIIGGLHDPNPATTPGHAACSAARISITDSIVHGRPGELAIDVPGGVFEIERSTVLGACRMGRAEVSNSLIDGAIEVQDAQGSCLRFSAYAGGSRVPGPYRCVSYPGGLPAGLFTSRRFGDWNYAMLALDAPAEIAEGAEHGTEMGAFNAALFPIRRNDLYAKIAEFAPIQALIEPIFET